MKGMAGLLSWARPEAYLGPGQRPILGPASSVSGFSFNIPSHHHIITLPFYAPMRMGAYNDGVMLQYTLPPSRRIYPTFRPFNIPYPSAGEYTLPASRRI